MRTIEIARKNMRPITGGEIIGTSKDLKYILRIPKTPIKKKEKMDADELFKEIEKSHCRSIWEFLTSIPVSDEKDIMSTYQMAYDKFSEEMEK